MQKMGRDDGRREKKTEEARLLLIEVARTGGSTQHGARGAVPVQSVYSLVLIVLYLWRVRKWRARRGAGAGWLAKELQDERTGHGKLHAWCGCWGGDERPPRLARGHERACVSVQCAVGRSKARHLPRATTHYMFSRKETTILVLMRKELPFPPAAPSPSCPADLSRQMPVRGSFPGNFCLVYPEADR